MLKNTTLEKGYEQRLITEINRKRPLANASGSRASIIALPAFLKRKRKDIDIRNEKNGVQE